MSRGGTKFGRKSRAKVAQSMDMMAEELEYERHVEQARAEWLEERAAIMEYDGGLTREQAEREAAKLLAKWKG
jgi:hypothetical protein